MSGIDFKDFNLGFHQCSYLCTGVIVSSDPRRGSRIQKGGGGSYIQKGGFPTGISGADPNCCRVLGKSTSKKKLQTAVGGVSDDPKKPLYPRM